MSNTLQQQNAPENDVSIPPDAIRCISGLTYLVLRQGTGNESPGSDDEVQVVYKAWTDTGQMFDTSNDNGNPTILSVREVIPGLGEALQLMRVGQKIRVWIPPNFSFNKLRESKQETLIFDIELVSFTRTREYPSLPLELTSPRKEE
jgi:FKBP-type peptidyl-prolyl cis-trans isomerase FklB